MKFAIILLLAVTVNAAYQCSLSSPQKIGNGLYLSQYMNPQDQTVTIELMYEGETWLGFGRSQNGKMIDAEAVIGRVDIPNSSTNPGKYYLSAESDSGVNLVDNQSLTNATVTVDSNGYTTLRFTKYLNENGEYSITGSGDTWIYAVGSTSGDTTYPKYHDMEGRVSLTLTPCTLVSAATPAPVSPAPVSSAPVATPAPVRATTPSPVSATTPASPTMSPASSGTGVSGTNTGGDGDDGEESGEGNGDGDGDDGEESGEGGEESGEGGDNDGDNDGGNENQGTDENDNGSSTTSGGSGNLNAGGASVNAGSSNGSSSAAPSTISRATASLLLVMLVAVLGM